MAQTDLAIRIATVLDAAGLNKAEKGIKTLDRSVKNLGRTMGVTLSAAAVVAFGKAAANAFIQDQKEASQLANVVKNLGLEFSNPAIASYIDNLSRATAVTDGQLRPALQSLLTTTGSLTKSQELLSQAIDISAGSGVELGQVANDLASAYVGKTKALGKYNLGLTQAELKTAKFTDLQEKLNEQYKGANAAYLTTYAGKMQALSTAAGEASETIGGALIDSVMLLSGSKGVDDLITKIDRLAEKTVGWIDKFSEGLAIINAIKNSNIGDMQKNIQAVQVEAYNAKLRRNYMKAWEGVNIPKTAAQIAAEKKTEADAAKRAKEIAKAQEKNTKELKKQNAVKLASKLFDMQQIQLVAALRGKLTEEERTRLEAQSAILNENETLATSLTKKILMAQDESGKLYQYFISIGDAKIKNPFAFLDEWLAEFQKKMAATKLPDLSKESTYTGGLAPELAAIGVKAGYGDFAGSVVNQASTELGNGSYGMQSTSGFVSTAAVTGTNVSVYVSGSVVTEQELVDAIQSGLRSNSLSGSPSQIGRIAGMFG